MRENVIQTLKSLSKEGKTLTDADIVAWANQKVASAGKSTQITSFKDSSIKTSKFFLDLLDSCRKGIIDYKLITAGETEEDQKMNGTFVCLFKCTRDSCMSLAKYAISVARKLGAIIFVLPEDIMEVKPKMMLTFVGAVMAAQMQA